MLKLLFAKNQFIFMHNFCSCLYESNKSDFVYVLVHRNIVMYDNISMPLIYVDVHLKTVLLVSLFSIIV